MNKNLNKETYSHKGRVNGAHSESPAQVKEKKIIST